MFREIDRLINRVLSAASQSPSKNYRSAGVEKSATRRRISRIISASVVKASTRRRQVLQVECVRCNVGCRCREYNVADDEATAVSRLHCWTPGPPVRERPPVIWGRPRRSPTWSTSTSCRDCPLPPPEAASASPANWPH